LPRESAGLHVDAPAITYTDRALVAGERAGRVRASLLLT
jgi:hypothetical protein